LARAKADIGVEMVEIEDIVELAHDLGE